MDFSARCCCIAHNPLICSSLLALTVATGCQSLHMPLADHSHLTAKMISPKNPGEALPQEVPVFDADTEITSSDAAPDFTPPPATENIDEKVPESRPVSPSYVATQSSTALSQKTSSLKTQNSTDLAEATSGSYTTPTDSGDPTALDDSTTGSTDPIAAAESAATPEAAAAQPDPVGKTDGNQAIGNRMVAQVDPMTRKDVSTATTPASPITGQQNTANKSLKFAMTPPGDMTWESTGKTAGGRKFQIVSSGDDGFHTLIVGSAVGNDPVAIQLAERLAGHLHENSLIFGGFQTTILRTLNPDGEAILKSVNGLGNNVNRGFPTTASATSNKSAPECDFLLKLITDLKPSRVVHLRTIPGAAGAVGASHSCQKLTEQIAESRKIRQFVFPEDINEGTMEFYLSSFTKTEVMTLAIPSELTSDLAWDLYQDALLNMIQKDPVKTQRGQQRSAADLSEN